MEQLQSLFEGYSINVGFLGYALCILIVADLLTGIAKGYKTDGIVSSKLRDGGFKKCGVLMVVAVSYALGVLLNDTNHLIAHGVMAYYVYTEIISVFENLNALGIPLPPLLANILGRK